MPNQSKRRKLIVLETYTRGSGADQTFGCRSTLPLGSASATESENAAARIMDATNAQLDFSNSSLRLVMHDIKLKKTVKISYTK